MKTDNDSIASSVADDGNGAADAVAIAEEMQTVLDDVDTFLASWCDRAQSDFDAVKAKGDAESDLQAKIDAFERKVQIWQAKRESEANRIEEQSAQLTEAWLRLESEQRTLLQMKEQRAQPTIDRSPQTQIANSSKEEPIAPANRSNDPKPVNDSGESLSNRIANRQATGSPRSESAIEQFQRLKQEVDRGRTDSAPR